MEGGATGRSHLGGRGVIQFGRNSTGNSVPFVMSSLLPGGMLAKPPDSPVAKAFPGRLSIGLLGHDEILRFPKIHYNMQGVCWVDDPFEVSIGSIDIKTGKVIGGLLYRGFIVQSVLLTLLSVEPRTPKASWYMRGTSAFERDPNGQTIFGFCGSAHIDYPERLLVPAARSEVGVHRRARFGAGSVHLPAGHRRRSRIRRRRRPVSRARAAGITGRQMSQTLLVQLLDSGLPVRQTGRLRVRERDQRRHLPHGQPGLGQFQ